MHYIDILDKLRHLEKLSLLSHHKRLQEAQYVAVTMGRLTLEHYRIVNTYFENGSSIRATHRKLRTFYDPHRRPSEQAITRIINEFRTTYSLKDTIQPDLIFFNEGIRITVNGDRYRTMMNDFFIENMEGIDLEEMWFQQDGATCHTANATVDLLKTKFEEQII